MLNFQYGGKTIIMTSFKSTTTCYIFFDQIILFSIVFLKLFLTCKIYQTPCPSTGIQLENDTAQKTDIDNYREDKMNLLHGK